MIEWLRGAVFEKGPADPIVEVSGRSLPIAIRRHPRARRLTMRLAPTGDELRITMPTWGHTAEAILFAKARSEWIAMQLARMPAPATPPGPGASFAFRGAMLAIEWQEGTRRKPRLVDDALQLGGPQDRIPGRVQRWLEDEALALISADLAFYCARAEQPLPALRLSRAQRRWGSCASSHARMPAIRINWRLVMAPDNVRRSVVAHEVAHLTHFDHSPAFHAHLAHLFEGDLAAADAWLKREGRSLYSPFG